MNTDDKFLLTVLRLALFFLAVAVVATCTGCTPEVSRKVTEGENQVHAERIWSDDGHENVFRFRDGDTTCYVFHGTISCVAH